MNLIGKLRRIKQLNKIKKNKKNINIGNNVTIKEWFQFRFDKTKSGEKYLVIGNNSVVSGQYITETEEAHITIGDRCLVNDGTSIIAAKSIDIGNDVIISWNVTIYDNDGHSTDYLERANDVINITKNVEKDWSHVNAKPIVIHDKAWIGFGSTILKGVEVGEGAIIAAKSVVTKDVEPYTVVAGNPAKFVKYCKVK